jgi:hypothetical protein
LPDFGLYWGVPAADLKGAVGRKIFACAPRYRPTVMSIEPQVTSIRIEKTIDGWCVIRHHNGEERVSHEFSTESDAQDWAEGQRILLGNFVTQNPSSL